MQTPTPGSNSLSGHCVLIVEDEYFLAEDLVDACRRLGAEIEGPFNNLQEALDTLSNHEISGAVLDVNLKNERTFPLAHALREREIPFVFTTGYDRSFIAAEFQDVPLWGKPFDIGAMTNELVDLILKSQKI
ncbi:response regulator [Bradyrhizobium sp. SYSU BS000235]|uniref:response regulator n=1 Tax=Bradyrhizobium sp. SYSU BS000235 TaxID=3411332 RepID=UPI003C7434F0